MKKMKHLITIAILLTITSNSFGQVGIGTTTPLGALDITATDDGLVIPRVALTISTSALPLTTPTTSELVYNTATIADVTPGYYYWDGGAWVRLGSGSVVETDPQVSSATNNRIPKWNGTTLVDGIASDNGTTMSVAGTTSTTNFQMTAGAAANYILQSDAAGNASWVNGNTGWLTTGNAGLASATNFLGTTDAVDVAFRRNNFAAGRIGANSTSFGLLALSVNTGSFNTGIGNNALRLNTAGQWNTAVGSGAMSNSVGAQNAVAIGSGALGSATAGGNLCVAVGVNTLGSSNVDNNTAVGANALSGALSGIENVALGKSALLQNSSGAFNTALGSEAMSFNTTTASNVAIGYRALRTGGGNCVAVGNNSLLNNSGANNTAVGHQSLNGNISGTGNVALGYQAGFSETTSNKLYISNSNTTATTSLIYGEFSPARILRTNGTFQIGDPTGTGYVFPIARGAVNEILQTNASGVLSWVAPSSLAVTETDPQVSSATNNTIPKWNGTTLVDGIVTDDGTNVGVGIAPSAGNKLDVAGKTRTTNLQMTAGATPNYFLQSDASGNGTWAPIPVNTVKPIVNTGALTGIYNVPLTEYTVRIFNGVSEVTLPNAVTNTGKVYILIGSNGIGSKILSTLGGVIYDDVTNTTITTITGGERIMIQSDGTDWLVIGR